MESLSKELSSDNKLLPQSQRLVRSDKGSNLIQWEENLTRKASEIFPEFHSCLKESIIPEEWIEAFVKPGGYSKMNSFDQALAIKYDNDREDLRERWRLARTSMATWLIYNLSEISQNRAKDQYRVEWVEYSETTPNPVL